MMYKGYLRRRFVRDKSVSVERRGDVEDPNGEERH